MSENESAWIRNETMRSIFQRHSTRSFQDRKIQREDLLSILEAANQAPSAHNQQSWKFIVVEDAKKVELVNLITTNASRFPRPAYALLRMAARSIASAPVVIAIINTGELIQRGPKLFQVDKHTAREFFRIMEIQSSAAAVENMLIAAASLGLSTVWLGILIMIQNEVLDFLKHPGGEFMAVVPVGYAQKATSGPKKRSLSAAVRYLK